MFIDLNGGVWVPDPPNIDDAEQAMVAIASHIVDEAWTAAWIRDRVQFATTPA